MRLSGTSARRMILQGMPQPDGAQFVRRYRAPSEHRRCPVNNSLGVLASIGLLGLLSSSQAVPIAPERSAAHGYQLPLTFEVNQGQTDDRVDFLARGPGYNIFLTATEAVFALPRAPAMRMQLVGSAADPRVQGVDALPGKVNYFRGQDSASWQTKVPTYRRVKYSAVYPGIDLVYYGQSQQLEYDFIVAPGADPGTIKLAFAGVEQTTVDAQGDLVLNTAGGPLRFQKPVIFQIDDGGRRQPVEGGYVHRSPHQIGFRVGAYDRTRPLIIDPVLSYSTYLGGSGYDEGNSIAVDATGAVYVTGTTASTDFPTVNAVQPTPNESGLDDIYVAKITPDGTALVYATYLGGRDYEFLADIAVDSAGAAYVSALTWSTDFPMVQALQPTCGCGSQNPDAVVAKLSADGSRLIYSTYLGGTSSETTASIAVDPAGAAYIAGQTLSNDFPLVNALQPSPGGNPNNTFADDAFVAKIAPDGTSLLYSTFLGGTDSDGASDIAVDSLGAAYIIGTTRSLDFPSVNPLAAHGGDYDAFVSKLAPDGTRLIYSTHLGGSGFEEGFGIAVDVSGAAYVTGNTASHDFPTINALQPQHCGTPRRLDLDAFVVKLAPEGGAMIYGTFLGGTGWDRGYRIAVDTAGAAHVTGFTDATNFPTMNPLQPASGGSRDAFVSKLTPNGAALVYSTYLGGGADDGDRTRPCFFCPPPSMGIAVDLTGATYVTGQTQSGDFPTTTSLQPVFGGGDGDAFVVKISSDNFFENFNDPDGAFMEANGGVRRSTHEGMYTEDRHYLTTTPSAYLSSDWIYEVTVRSPSNGPPDILFIGIGSARPDPTFYNEPANSLEFRIHQGWIDGRVDVAANPTGGIWTYAVPAIGYLPADSGTAFTEFTARITKVGNTIEFSICKRASESEPCEPQFSHEVTDLSAAAPFLNSDNSHLFFGNGSGSYVFTKATISPGPANDSGSERDVDSGGGSVDALSRRGGGGGTMDAVFLVLLAQLAFAGALRRRSGPVR